MKEHIFCKKVVFVVMLLIFGVMFFFIKHQCSLNLTVLAKNQIIPWGVKSLNVPALWFEVTGKGVKIAVLDSGINFKHPDMGEIKEGYNAIEPNQPPIDDFGHGTLVSGVVAAKNNKFGIVGIAPDAELYPVKVLDKYGEGDITAIADGIDWCIKNNIQIINMSFAMTNDNSLLHSSITKAVDAGIIVVASAYNSYGGQVGYPASYAEVISVTSVDDKLRIGDTSPKGKIDFSAPGVDILSTSNDGGYEKFSGTSIATPYITGIIALMLQNPQIFGLPNKDKAYSYEDVYKALKEYSKDLGEKGKDNVFGEGFIILRNK